MSWQQQAPSPVFRGRLGWGKIPLLRQGGVRGGWTRCSSKVNYIAYTLEIGSGQKSPLGVGALDKEGGRGMLILRMELQLQSLYL